MSVLCTYGHGTETAERTARLLLEAGIELLVDVRSFPCSPRNRHLDRTAMSEWLPAAGVPYQWEPRLGGRRRCPPGAPDVAWEHPSFRGYAVHMRTPEFADAMGWLLETAATRRVAVMCSESVWWKCHRRMIADFTQVARGTEVRHLMHDGKLRPHRPIAGTRLRDDGLLVYDGGQLPLFAATAA